jgi:hypothetical protein
MDAFAPSEIKRRGNSRVKAMLGDIPDIPGVIPAAGFNGERSAAANSLPRF